MIMPSGSIVLVDQAYTVDTASTASFAGIASVAGSVSLGSSIIVSGLNISNNGAVTASYSVSASLNISSSYAVDTIPLSRGNSVKWIVFLESGANSRVSKVVATWHNLTSSYYTTEVKSTGNVPVDLSATCSLSGISLIVSPQTGSWNVRFLKTVI